MGLSKGPAGLRKAMQNSPKVALSKDRLATGLWTKGKPSTYRLEQGHPGRSLLRLGVKRGIRTNEATSLTYECLPRKEMWLREKDAH